MIQHALLIPVVIALAVFIHWSKRFINPKVGWIEWTEYWALSIASFGLTLAACYVVLNGACHLVTGKRIPSLELWATLRERFRRS